MDCVSGPQKQAECTSQTGPKSLHKGRGAKKIGYLTSSGKFIKVKEMVPEFVVPNLTGFKLRPYVSYKAPPGTEEPMTPKTLLGNCGPSNRKRTERGHGSGKSGVGDQ
ncbi:hypothetical protein GDO86_014762 [Hymenochirus boettgeri]|uniref:Mitochondrial ribosomal protein L41 n=1 Tax=Hymenochirus boettgeri TaxID=247094 RepID=A0A8T2JVV8_9PIPI|nr:hypothetical protein GDO86_014762 [Hymenochirus boettgeri]